MSPVAQSVVMCNFSEFTTVLQRANVSLSVRSELFFLAFSSRDVCFHGFLRLFLSLILDSGAHDATHPRSAFSPGRRQRCAAASATRARSASASRRRSSHDGPAALHAAAPSTQAGATSGHRGLRAPPAGFRPSPSKQRVRGAGSRTLLAGRARRLPAPAAERRTSVAHGPPLAGQLHRECGVCAVRPRVVPRVRGRRARGRVSVLTPKRKQWT